MTETEHKDLIAKLERSINRGATIIRVMSVLFIITSTIGFSIWFVSPFVSINPVSRTMISFSFSLSWMTSLVYWIRTFKETKYV